MGRVAAAHRSSLAASLGYAESGPSRRRRKMPSPIRPSASATVAPSEMPVNGSSPVAATCAFGGETAPATCAGAAAGGAFFLTTTATFGFGAY